MNVKQLLSLLLALGTCLINVSAKDDPEERHVNVILFSGDTISGYLRNDVKTGLKNMFSKSGSIRQYINLAEMPDGGETKRYSASEVREYRFTEPTEAYPEGALRVSERINSPVPFTPNASVRGFAWVLDRRDCGAVLRWDVWESTGGRNSVSRLVPAIGVKFKGAKAAYILLSNGLFTPQLLFNYLKKQHPDLKKALEDYYWKCEDAKAHVRELKDNPTTILQFYEDFLKDHEPIADPQEEKL